MRANWLVNAVSTTDFQQLVNCTCTTLSNGSIKTNKELEKTKKEVVAHFKTLLQHLPWTLIRKLVHNKRPRGRSVKAEASELRTGECLPVQR
jgi:phosphoribosyl-dephospho-CoA transferase